MDIQSGGVDPDSIELSIIIPSYNAASTLTAQLDALAKQTWEEPWELIVADNGSTDATRDTIRPYLKRFPNWRLVDASEKPGPGYARNVGASAARGRNLAFCDADDVVGHGWVSAVGRALKKNSLVSSRMEFERLNQEIEADDRTPQTSLPQQLGGAQFLPYTRATGLAIERDLFEDLGGFDDALLCGEDIDLCWRAGLEGINLHLERDAVVHYRLRERSLDRYKQVFNYAYWTVALYKRYKAHGMPRVNWQAGLAQWIYLLTIRSPELLKSSSRSKWIESFARRSGLLVGSVRFKALML